MVDEAEVRDALRDVYDPEIPVNVVDLGLVYDVTISDGHVEVEMTLTSMGCPIADQIFGTVSETVADLDGVSAVEVQPTWDPPWSPEKATDAGQQKLRAMGISF
ncbi:MAG: metal-sulfur cluster assembly factor [Halorhabdus sp.]